jgi:hypothetical protein
MTKITKARLSETLKNMPKDGFFSYDDELDDLSYKDMEFHPWQRRQRKALIVQPREQE